MIKEGSNVPRKGHTQKKNVKQDLSKKPAEF